MEELNVISLGAGKQSSYMLLTALEGAYKYKPDVAIFADTECEPQYVYTYLDWLIGYVKDEFNFDIIKVSKGSLVTDTIDYLDGKNRRGASIPLFSEISGGPINRQCTADYKISPVRVEG
jgi:3'-phosphoadenosine 5'-phosphosulfate sulfotransferase (PAPS reductase)/FAD synthetase